MQGAWWYLVGDSPRGPVSMEVLEAMLHQGEMTQHSLVWREGLSGWIPVAQLPTLQAIGAVPPEPAPLTALERAGAWRRFLARMADLGIICAPVVLLLLPLLMQLPEFALWRQSPSSDVLLGFGFLPLALLAEAGIFACFGTTPGKALLGVTVMTLDGQRLTAGQYLQRQIGVFCFGFAMGLPLLSLIAMAAQGLNLQHGESTPYDEDRYMVRAHRLSTTRMLVLAGMGCAAIGLGFARG